MGRFKRDDDNNDNNNKEIKIKTTTIMYKRKLNRNCTLLLWNIKDDCLLPSDGESLAVSHQ
jgi:hypothetical protein